MIQPLNRWKALMGKLFRKLGLAAVIVAGLTLGEAGVRDEQTAEADTWELWISPQEMWCEGCCPSGQLCCEVNHACRVTPVLP